MTQKIREFRRGNKFQITGRKFGGIYGKRVFTVEKIDGNSLTATAVDYKGNDDGILHCFSQTNFNYYDSAVVRIGDLPNDNGE